MPPDAIDLGQHRLVVFFQLCEALMIEGGVGSSEAGEHKAEGDDSSNGEACHRIFVSHVHSFPASSDWRSSRNNRTHTISLLVILLDILVGRMAASPR